MDAIKVFIFGRFRILFAKYNCFQRTQYKQQLYYMLYNLIDIQQKSNKKKRISIFFKKIDSSTVYAETDRKTSKIER